MRASATCAAEKKKQTRLRQGFCAAAGATESVEALRGRGVAALTKAQVMISA